MWVNKICWLIHKLIFSLLDHSMKPLYTFSKLPTIILHLFYKESCNFIFNRFVKSKIRFRHPFFVNLSLIFYWVSKLIFRLTLENEIALLVKSWRTLTIFTFKSREGFGKMIIHWRLALNFLFLYGVNFIKILLKIFFWIHWLERFHIPNFVQNLGLSKVRFFGMIRWRRLINGWSRKKWILMF